MNLAFVVAVGALFFGVLVMLYVAKRQNRPPTAGTDG